MKFRKDGTVGAPEVRCLERLLEHAVTIRIELEVIRLLIAVIVANVERRAGIDPVGEQEVETELLVKAVVLADVSEEKPVGKLIRRQRAEDVDVEHEVIAGPRVGKPIGVHVDSGLELRNESKVDERVPADVLP